jgi:hypothetical protein
MAARVALTILSVVAFVTLAALLEGCGATLPDRSYTPNNADAVLFDEIERRWTAAGLPSLDTERCAELRQYMRIVVANDEEFPTLCTGYCNPGNCPGYRPSSGCPWGCAAECYTTPCVGSWPHCWADGEFLGGHEFALLTVHESRAPGGYPERALVRHSYIHHLGSCSGRGSDSGHRDGLMWGLDTDASPGEG